MQVRLNTIIIVLLFFSLPLAAQKKMDFSFDHLMAVNGFPSEVVTSMTPDTSGNIWAITEKGLMRYNGHSGKFYPVRQDSTGPLSNEGYKIFRTRKGILWISYFSGSMSSFDPLEERFTHYLHDTADATSFPFDAIAADFYEDSKGNLWIPTWGGGLLKYLPETDNFKQWMPEEGNPNSVSTVAVTCIEEDKDGTFLVGTWEGLGYNNAMHHFDPVKETFSRFSVEGFDCTNEHEYMRVNASFKIVHFIRFDEKDNIWVGTYTGLYYVDRTAKTIRRVTAVSEDHASIVTLGNYENVIDAVVDNDNKMWVTTEVGGIVVVDLATHVCGYLKRDVFSKSSLSSDIIRDLFKDADGNIWVSTAAGGIDIYCPAVQQFKIIPNAQLSATPSNAQRPYYINEAYFSAFNNNIYISSGSGVTIYDETSGNSRQVNLMAAVMKELRDGQFRGKYVWDSPNNVMGIAEFSDRLMINIALGVVFYDLKTGKFDFSQLGDYHNMYFSDVRNETAYISYWHEALSDSVSQMRLHLLKYDNRKRRLEPVYLYTDTIAEWHTSKSVAWLDTTHLLIDHNEHTLLVYDIAADTMKAYSYHKPYSNFPDTSLFALTIDASHHAWIKGTNGLYEFDPLTGETKNHIEHLGLTEKDVIYCMTIDKNGLHWIGLRRDLIRYNPTTGETFRFTKKLGLDVGGFITRFTRVHNRDSVYLPTNYGLLYFNPDNIRIVTTKPTINLSEVIINKDTLPEKEKIAFGKGNQVLKWNENFITFEFASSQTYSPGSKIYEYRLAGMDTTWQNNGNQNRVSYTNLKPGEYVFEVRCTNVYGVTSETLQLAFSIGKPFWLMWWFILLEVTAGLIILVLLIKWRERKLRKDKEKLEETVEIRTQEVREKVKEIETQKDIIEEKNKELTDSIKYAKRIQNTLLAHEELLKENLPGHFVFFRPKDIVSGDFYWAAKTNDAFYLAVCDSTGHGVPGAFMSLLNIRFLNEAIAEKNISSPDKILDYVRQKLITDLSHDGAKDGMDGTVIRFDPDRKKITYASAHNAPLLVRNGEPMNLPADKMPIGLGERMQPFALHEISLQKGDRLYFFTDGYQDQFGGPKGKKLKHKNLVAQLVADGDQKPSTQAEHLDAHLASWKGELEQVDDILVIGIFAD